MKKAERTPPAGTVFADATALLGTGVDALFERDGPMVSALPLDEIDVKEQVRTEFEDEDNKLKDLAASIAAHGVIQPILVRPHLGRHQLVAGERRYRAAKLAGKKTIPAFIRDISDAEFDDLQFAENVQRKNLTQIEIATRLRRDFERVGKSLTKLSQLHKKSKPWLSKMLNLAELPEQTARLVKENISADVEAINAVRQLEKESAEAAKAVVDEMKGQRGKIDARATARHALAEAKQAKKPTKAATLATAKNRRHETPGAATRHAAPAHVLGKVWGMVEKRKRPETILAALEDGEAEVLIEQLRPMFNQGHKARDTAHAVLAGLRSGSFAPDGHGALALAAFLRGADSGSTDEFALDDILKAARVE